MEKQVSVGRGELSKTIIIWRILFFVSFGLPQLTDFMRFVVSLVWLSDGQVNMISRVNHSHLNKLSKKISSAIHYLVFPAFGSYPSTVMMSAGSVSLKQMSSQDNCMRPLENCLISICSTVHLLLCVDFQETTTVHIHRKVRMLQVL